MIRKHAANLPVVEKAPPPLYANLGRAPNRPPDMPVYTPEFMKTEPLLK